MHRILIALLTVTLGLFAGCGKKPESDATAPAAAQAQAEEAAGQESATAQLQAKAEEVATQVASFTQEQKDALVQKMKSALQDAGSLDNLQQSASNALNNLAGGNGNKTQDLLKKVESAKNTLQERLAAVQQATPDNWEEAKAKAEDALAKLQTALKNLREG